MNYFAHGLRHVERPYVLAGTAVPDWLCVADRRVRARAKRAAELLEDTDPRVAEIAAGIIRHHRDDAWFHGSRAFVELSLSFTQRIRAALPPDEGIRCSFLGHIVVELLLDAELAERQPERLRAYYQSLETVDAGLVQAAVNRIVPAPTERLAEFIAAFLRESFLWDYADDKTLCMRLNQVLCRVGLSRLPDSFAEVLPGLRGDVRLRMGELLPVA